MNDRQAKCCLQKQAVDLTSGKFGTALPTQNTSRVIRIGKKESETN